MLPVYEPAPLEKPPLVSPAAQTAPERFRTPTAPNPIGRHIRKIGSIPANKALGQSTRLDSRLKRDQDILEHLILSGISLI